METGMVLLTGRAALAAHGVNVDSVIAALAAGLAALPGVARVDRPADLAGQDTSDPLVRRWRPQVPPDARLEPVRAPQPDSVLGPPGMRHAVHAGRVRSIDIAPTLARLLDLTPGERLDGRVLTELWP